MSMTPPNGMKAGHWIDGARATRFCTARRVIRWDREDAKDRLYRGDAQGGFQLVGDGDWPATETWFDVAFDAGSLYVSVMTTQACSRDTDTVEVLFDPFLDRIGYCQFMAGSDGARAEGSHWPYRDPERNRFRDPAWSVEMEECPCDEELVRLFFFRIDLSRVRTRDCIGLNVCRTQSRVEENSTWNRSDGFGFPDAGCFGRLCFVAPRVVIDRALLDVARNRLWAVRLEGVRARRGARLGLRLVDPEGDTIARFSPRAAGKTSLTFRTRDGTNLRPSGRYRLVVDAVSGTGAASSDPDEFFFDYRGGKPRPFQLQGTYDFPDGGGYYRDPACLEAEMRWYRDCGLDRVYWMDYRPEYYKRFGDRLKKFGGDYLQPAVRAAHQAGLECVTIFKPFDLGEDMAFFRHNPGFGLRRNPVWTTRTHAPIRTIRLYQADEAPFPFGREGITVWESRDNRTYRPAPVGKIVEAIVRRREGVWSPRGRLPGGEERAARCLRIEGLSLDAPFLAVTADGCDPSVTLRNRAWLAAEIEDADGTVLPHVLDASGSPESGFDLAANQVNHAGWLRADSGPERLLCLRGSRLCLGFALEPEMRMPGFLEPCFPEVRAFWLDYLRRGIEADADGVSLRIAHHIGCADWLSHMWAEPVLEEFRRRTGREPEPRNEDYTLARRIRGEAYTQFLREASAMARQAGKTLLHHIENRMLVPAEYDAYSQIYWDWPTWIREKLFDEIDLKYLGANHPDVYREIAPMARKAGMKVNVITAEPKPRSWPRSIRQAPRLLRQALESGLNGIDLYELWLYHRYTDRGTPLARGCGEAVIREMRAMMRSGG